MLQSLVRLPLVESCKVSVILGLHEQDAVIFVVFKLLEASFNLTVLGYPSKPRAGADIQHQTC